MALDQRLISYSTCTLLVFVKNEPLDLFIKSTGFLFINFCLYIYLTLSFWRWFACSRSRMWIRGGSVPPLGWADWTALKETRLPEGPRKEQTAQWPQSDSLPPGPLPSNFSEKIYRSLFQWLLFRISFFLERRENISFPWQFWGDPAVWRLQGRKEHSLTLRVVLLCGWYSLNQSFCNFNAAESRNLSTRKCFFMLILNSGFILLKWNGE